MLRTQASSDYGFSVNIGFLSCGHLSLAVFLAALLITLWAWMQWGWPLVPAFCFLPLYLHIISWVKERSLALHCTAPNWTELHCTALHCIALHYTAQHCNALEFTSMQFTKRHCTAQHYTKLNWTELNWTVLHCTELHWTEPNSTSLNCTALHWTALECTETWMITLLWASLSLHWPEPKGASQTKKIQLEFWFHSKQVWLPPPPLLEYVQIYTCFFSSIL